MVTGNNLVAVWYERPAIDGDDWIPKTFETSSHWEAINALKVGYGISSDYDKDWLTDELNNGNSNVAPFLAFSQGLVATDPLVVSLQGAPARDFWIDVLTDGGYKAADVNFDKGATGTCDQWGWLEEMKTEVETTLASSSTIAGADRFESFVKACQVTTPGTGVVAVIVIGTPVLTPIVPTTDGQDPTNSGVCTYTVCEFRWEKRIVSVLNPNPTGPARQCFCEKRGIERCCTTTPGNTFCPKNPNGSCPAGNNPVTACGGAVAAACPLPLTTVPWKIANWQRETVAVPCTTLPGNCP